MSRVIMWVGIVLMILVVGLVLVLPKKEPPNVPLQESNASPAPVVSQAGPMPDIPALSVEVVPVTTQVLERTIKLPGELHPFLSVDMYPKITGIVNVIDVDRGSVVKKGQQLLRLSASELQAQRVEAEAQLRGAKITYARLQSAAATPGVVAGNDLELAQHNQEALEARVRSLQEMERYLQVTAPFDGVITQRNVHPGAVVGPSGAVPALRLEQVSHLRLIGPVPEVYAGSIAEGSTVQFTVPAYPEETFTGVISRVARSVDQKTRTMPVEMDVSNQDGRLASGMFPEVLWPVRRPAPSLFVPRSAIVTTTEQTFVVRVKNEEVEWVSVRKGSESGALVEVFGSLEAGDHILLRGTDEIRPGTRVIPVLRKETT